MILIPIPKFASYLFFPLIKHKKENYNYHLLHIVLSGCKDKKEKKRKAKHKDGVKQHISNASTRYENMNTKG